MSEVWNLDQLEKIGGHMTVITGEPIIGTSEKGKSVFFDGIDDGLVVESNPIFGSTAFTIEIIFKPELTNNPNNTEQRFVHIQNMKNENSRILIELRLTKDNQWFLDTFSKSDDAALTLYAEKYPHALGQWYHAALVYENGTLKHFVNGIEEMAGPVNYVPIEEGHTSIGMRINHISWFKGSIKTIRMTKSALKPGEFLSI